MIKKLLLILAVSTAASSWLLFAPPLVEDARADTPQWAGWVSAVRTQTRPGPDAPLTFTWTSRFDLWYGATDIAETTFFGQYRYDLKRYGLSVIAGRYLSEEVTGSGSGSGEGASLWVDYSASTTEAGYYVAVSGGVFPVTTTQVQHFLSEPYVSSSTVTADYPTFKMGAFVPSVADDKYMLEGVQVSEQCFETECIKEEVRFAVGRVSCMGGPDANGDGITDDDGLNGCRELDRRTAAGSPDTDTDGDGIPDSTDTDTTGAAPPGTTDGGSQTPGSDECSGFFSCNPWVPIAITVVVVAAVVVAAVVVVPGLLAGGAATGGVAAAAQGATLVSAGGAAGGAAAGGAAAGGAAAGGAAVAGAAEGAALATAGAAVGRVASEVVSEAVTSQAQAAVEERHERREDRPRPGAG